MTIRSRTLTWVLLTIHALLLGWSAYRHSPTLDEVGHLPAGVRCWQQQAFDLYCVNPPLVKMLAALPVVLLDPRTDWADLDDSSGMRPEWQVGRRFIEANGDRAFLFFTLARWACILLSVIGGYCCFQWARQAIDQVAAENRQRHHHRAATHVDSHVARLVPQHEVLAQFAVGPSRMRNMSVLAQINRHIAEWSGQTEQQSNQRRVSRAVRLDRRACQPGALGGTPRDSRARRVGHRRYRRHRRRFSGDLRFLALSPIAVPGASSAQRRAARAGRGEQVLAHRATGNMGYTGRCENVVA